ncbi:MAG: hypothetical protein GW749_01990 [Alphaproteobacteria bacterium]|nr:hypothetical protein [Alphaproteobacteria bacterium]
MSKNKKPKMSADSYVKHEAAPIIFHVDVDRELTNIEAHAVVFQLGGILSRNFRLSAEEAMTRVDEAFSGLRPSLREDLPEAADTRIIKSNYDIAMSRRSSPLLHGISIHFYQRY